MRQMDYLLGAGAGACELLRHAARWLGVATPEQAAAEARRRRVIL